jgi:magnesium-transporting ATPase (P-type)
MASNGAVGSPFDKLPEVNDLATMSEEQLCSSLQTDSKRGHDDAKAERLLEEFGTNQLKQPPKPTLLMLFIVQLTNLIIMLLIASAVASFIVNGTGDKNDDVLSYIEGIAIFVIVLLNAGIAAVTENSANDALEKLSKMTAPDASVVRGGVEKKVKTTNIVPGDLVVLNVGDVVPADMRMLSASDLKVSEMPLTGEPDDVPKKAQIPKKADKSKGEEDKLRPENVAYSGCNVTSGTARGIVIRTGMHTEVGKIAGMLNNGDDGEKTTCFCLPDTAGNMTPLQESLQNLGVKIGFMAIGVCAVVFIVGLLRQTKDPQDINKPTWLYMILISVTLAVAAIPEGIPLCVTISLSFGSTSLKDLKVLVRKLAAVETLGSASVICTDKTGTLTEGKMRTVNLWCGQDFYTIDGSGFDPTSGKVKNKDGQVATQDPPVRTVLLAALLNSNASVDKITKNGVTQWEPKGNSSEAPLVVAAQKIDLTRDIGERAFPRLFEVPFSSSRKMMLTGHGISGQTKMEGMELADGSKVLVVVKGAPDRVLKVCSKRANRDGTVCELTQSMRDEVMMANNEFASQALRSQSSASTIRIRTSAPRRGSRISARNSPSSAWSPTWTRPARAWTRPCSRPRAPTCASS